MNSAQRACCRSMPRCLATLFSLYVAADRLATTDALHTTFDTDAITTTTLPEGIRSRPAGRSSLRTKK